MKPLRHVIASLLAVNGMGAPAGQDPAFHLPEIESVMMKATDKVMDFAAQAAAMQARVAQKQAESKAAVAVQKRKYEQRLVKQAEMNHHMEKINDGIRHKIHTLEDGNEVIKIETKAVQQENLAMREILGNLVDKVRAAKMFAADSLAITDDSQAEQLRVLLPSKQKPTLAHFLAAAAASGTPTDKYKAAPWLLQTASEDAGYQATPAEAAEAAAEAAEATAAAPVPAPEAPEARPEDLVSVLSGSLAELDDAERDGEAQLQSHFEAAYDQGAQQFEALSEIQKEINTTKDALEKRRQELQAARAHLRKTREQLKQRLRGVNVFSEKVAGAVKEALKRVPVLERNRRSQATEAPNATWPTGLLEIAAKGHVDQVPLQKQVAGLGGQGSKKWFWSW